MRQCYTKKEIQGFSNKVETQHIPISPLLSYLEPVEVEIRETFLILLSLFLFCQIPSGRPQWNRTQKKNPKKCKSRRNGSVVVPLNIFYGRWAASGSTTCCTSISQYGSVPKFKDEHRKGEILICLPMESIPTCGLKGPKNMQKKVLSCHYDNSQSM